MKSVILMCKMFTDMSLHMFDVCVRKYFKIRPEDGSKYLLVCRHVSCVHTVC
jgi:hypothetical protein